MANTKRVFFGPRFASPAFIVKVRGEHGCMVTGNLASIPGQAECYLSGRPDGVVDVFYSEHCAQCGGSGRYCASRRTMAWKPCRVCNGQPDFVEETFLYSLTN
jgi:hypothetical protein